MELDLIVIFPKDGNFAKFAALSPQWVDVVILVLINCNGTLCINIIHCFSWRTLIFGLFKTSKLKFGYTYSQILLNPGGIVRCSKNFGHPRYPKKKKSARHCRNLWLYDSLDVLPYESINPNLFQI